MNEARRLTQNFISSYPIARFGKGQPILLPGEDLTKIHYLVEGTVIQYDISKTGSTVVLKSFQPNSLFPLSHVFDSEPIDFFFEANSPVSTRIIPKEQLYNFITNTPVVMSDILAQSFRTSNELLQRVSYSMGGSASSRIIFELLNTAKIIGEKNTDGSIFIPLSENDIAKRTGLSRETVNRMLRRFKQSNTLRATNQGIEVISIKTLEETLSGQK